MQHLLQASGHTSGIEVILLFHGLARAACTAELRCRLVKSSWNEWEFGFCVIQDRSLILYGDSGLIKFSQLGSGRSVRVLCYLVMYHSRSENTAFTAA
jgi:hypothetical protein